MKRKQEEVLIKEGRTETKNNIGTPVEKAINK